MNIMNGYHEDTIIDTMHGYLKLRNVIPGDYVRSPFGWARVDSTQWTAFQQNELAIKASFVAHSHGVYKEYETIIDSLIMTRRELIIGPQSKLVDGSEKEQIVMGFDYLNDLKNAPKFKGIYENDFKLYSVSYLVVDRLYNLRVENKRNRFYGNGLELVGM